MSHEASLQEALQDSWHMEPQLYALRMEAFLKLEVSVTCGPLNLLQDPRVQERSPSKAVC